VKLAFIQGPAGLLDYLQQKGFSGVYIDRGKVIQDFLQADLIDELIISKVPVLIGTGISLFGNLTSDLNFKHIRTEPYSNGLVKSYNKRKDYDPK
jgi:dihydrofolate reductase